MTDKNQMTCCSAQQGQLAQQEASAGQASSSQPTRTHYYRPNADISEFPGEYRIELDLPGASGENVEIQFEDGALTVVAHVASRQASEARFLLREYGVADYRRSFQLSDRVDAARIRADFSGGVLTLTLPKVEAAQPRKIAVHVG